MRNILSRIGDAIAEQEKGAAMKPEAPKLVMWIGNGKEYSRNPLCMAPERDCPGVCIYCLEYGKIDDSLEVK